MVLREGMVPDTCKKANVFGDIWGAFYPKPEVQRKEGSPGKMSHEGGQVRCLESHFHTLHASKGREQLPLLT